MFAIMFALVGTCGVFVVAQRFQNLYDKPDFHGHAVYRFPPQNPRTGAGAIPSASAEFLQELLAKKEVSVPSILCLFRTPGFFFNESR